MTAFSRRARWCFPLFVVAGWMVATGADASAAALRPALITADLSTQYPYRDCALLVADRGEYYYTGTATSIRRYTALTAGHMLYAASDGFSINVRMYEGLYVSNGYPADASSVNVLAGYQDTGSADPTSDAAFDQDLGYLTLSSPALDNDWADWTTDLSLLQNDTPCLVLGYAAKTFEGTTVAYVQPPGPFAPVLTPALYASHAYYTEGGMSGGPVYVTSATGRLVVAAVTIAGTAFPQKPLSDVRAITPDVAPLLLDAEYAHGVIVGGVIAGPAVVTAGKTVKFKTGVVFSDRSQEGSGGVPVRYDGDVKLVAGGPYKKLIGISEVKPGKHAVAFPASIPAGTQVTLNLFRTATPQKSQTPLKTLTITVQ